MVVTGARSRTGATLFAKNSDRKLGECQPLLQFAAALHRRGEDVRCTHIAIPQVAETYRVMGHSPWWVWGFEHGINEHGVAIGNQTVFSKEPVEQTPGLIGMDLVRLGLERGRDAREALEVIASLLETYGQGGSAFGPGAAGYHNSFMIADPQEAWVMETSGRRWAARRVECASLTNHLTLGTDWRIGSRDRAETFDEPPGKIPRGDGDGIDERARDPGAYPAADKSPRPFPKIWVRQRTRCGNSRDPPRSVSRASAIAAEGVHADHAWTRPRELPRARRECARGKATTSARKGGRRGGDETREYYSPRGRTQRRGR